MERIVQKEYNIEILGSGNTLKVLRHLLRQPYMLKGITEIAGDLKISRSNVYRALQSIERLGLVIPLKHDKKKLYRTDTSSRLVLKFFEIFVQERFMNLPSKLANVLSVLSHEASSCQAMILFGSCASGLSHEQSDVDLCCVCEREEAKNRIRKLSRKYYPDFRLEIHFYDKQALQTLNDFVVLDSLLNGIPFAGAELVFRHLARIQSFPKAYMLYRLQRCDDYVKKMKKASGAARGYFRDLINVTVGEINSILKLKTTVPKASVKKTDGIKVLGDLHNAIAERGDEIWLI